MLTVVAQLIARKGSEETVRRELLALLQPSRQDDGCLSYDLHESADAPGTFLFYENWKSKASLDAHLNQPHLQKALALIGPFLAEPPQITLWKKLSG
jgi:quinol monooxygenase YgiN